MPTENRASSTTRIAIITGGSRGRPTARDRPADPAHKIRDLGLYLTHSVEAEEDDQP